MGSLSKVLGVFLYFIFYIGGGNLIIMGTMGALDSGGSALPWKGKLSILIL